MYRKEFLEDLGLFIMKNNLLIQFVENVQLQSLALHMCSKSNFLSRKQFSQDILPSLVEKTKNLDVLRTLT